MKNATDNSIIKKWLPVIVCTAILLVCFFITGVFEDAWNVELAGVEAESEAVATQTEAIKKEKASAQTEIIYEAGDIEASRLDNDEATISSLLKNVFTWDDFKSYSAARQSLIDDYGISEDSWLLTTYMPFVEVEVSAGGFESNMIDSRGMNMSVQSSDVRLINKDDEDNYDYLVHVITASKFKDQTGTSPCAMFVTCDKSGKVVAIDAMSVKS